VGKLVILRLDGDFEHQGFRVALEIGSEGDRPTIEIAGALPPNLDLVRHLRQWQQSYRQLGGSNRITPQGIIYGGSVNRMEDCRQEAQALQACLLAWLGAKSFHAVDQRLREALDRQESIRVLIRTANNELRQLPWHLWDLIERYPKAEIALSAPTAEKVEAQSKAIAQGKVRILAILGNRTGIDIEADRKILKRLPKADVTFLVEPQRQQINHQLWDQHWDMLFFAGHSQTEGDKGRIYLNAQESLTLDELKYGLRQAIAKGLQLVIFNSCDGLGLAYELEQLCLPQIIVMREPVPDQVAQAFLKHFLAAFAQGDSLYLAERRARERLQGLEGEFPCASWLPVLCQNSMELPPTWHAWCHGTAPTHPVKPRILKLSHILLASAIVTSLLMGVRLLGWLQPLELKAFDQMLRLRPDEGPDQRLLVVAITDNDIRTHERGRGSLSDRTLNRLLAQLEQYQPRAIGLDLYRDFTVEPGQRSLATRLKQTPKLIAICKASDNESNFDGVAPPPEVPPNRLGFSDFVKDADGVIRRQLLFMTPDLASPCAAPYAFSTELAFRYLAAAAITPHFTANQDLQLGTTVFQRLRSRTGGYQGLDARGSQILLNYRSLRKPAEQVTLTQILTKQINLEAVKDRIVLIGVTARSSGDYWSTPRGAGPLEEMPGVMIHAQMVSQMLNAVLNQRSLLWTWSQWGEVSWILVWSLVGGVLAWRMRSPLYFCIVLVMTAGALYGACYSILLAQSGWVPFVPSVLALIATGSCVKLVYFLNLDPCNQATDLKGEL
jgi:CHASE2 domain-containing sensor protein